MTEVKFGMTEVKQEKSTMTEMKLEVKLSCRSYDRNETKGMTELKLIHKIMTGLK